MWIKAKKVSKKEFTEFMHFARKDVSTKDIQVLFDHLNSDRDESGLDVMEFVRGIEELSVRRLLDDKANVGPRHPWVVWMKVRIFERNGFNELVMVIVSLQIWVLAMYGTLDGSNEPILDYSLSILICIQAAEIALKVVSFGFHEYWWWANFHDKGVFQMFANRVEFCIILTTVAFFLYVAVFARGFRFHRSPQSQISTIFPHNPRFHGCEEDSISCLYVVSSNSAICIRCSFVDGCVFLLRIYWHVCFLGKVFCSRGGRWGPTDANFDNLQIVS
eukprot:TRINITY_DN21_c0_g1_i4.p1 TRINITY_DN21_c0_g1~~TRINITY_DN21_c0_g1_i4.p1  ORF type:complete len:275 (-),score=26.31 TRINITY_DN21_c0_g1_i4:395-1219(-)